MTSNVKIPIVYGIFGIQFLYREAPNKLVKNVRIETLNHKIEQLQTRKKKLEAKKTIQLTKILNRCGANKISNEILAGIVLEAVRAYKQNDSRVSTWESEGLKILNPGRGRKKFI